jgi:multiple sugar transport system substrate-binding protein
MPGKGSNGKKSLDCRQVKALLGAFLEDGLPPQQKAAVRTHLQGCADCRRKADQEATLASHLRLEAAGRHHRLSPQAATRIQSQVYRRMRRSMMGQRVSRFALGAVGVLVLALVAVGGYAYWQWWQQDAGQPTPVAGPTPTEGPAMPTETPVPPQSDAVVITFACSNNDQGYYRELAQAFHEENPSIQVQVVASDAVFGNEEGDLQELAASADSFALQRSLEPQDIQSGLLRDLQPFVEADLTFNADDFYPGLLDRYRWQGGLWGLPSPGTPLLLFYDKAAFDEAGLPYPEPGWSYKEFEVAAGILTQDQGEGTTRYGLVVSPRSLAGPILVMGRAEGWAEGIDVLPEPILDAPTVVEAAQWFVDLARLQRFMPNPYELEDGQMAFVVEEVQEGRAALWDGWPAAYMMEVFHDSYDDVGITTFPEGTPIVDWVGGAPYSMSAGTAHPDEVWRWLRFLTYQPGNVSEVQPPVRRSVAEATGYWDKLDPELLPAVRYIMERPKVSLPPGMLLSLRETLEAVLVNSEEVQTALARAQRDLTGALGSPVSQALPQPVATPQPASAAGEGVVIEFAVRNYWELQKAYERLAAEFHELHPEISVKPKSPDYEEGYQTVTLPWLATQGDCFESFYPPHEEEKSAILSLDPLLETDAAFSVDDFYPQLLELFYQAGSLWAFPAESYPRVMYYNKALFDEAGLAYPSPDWTFDDFAAAAASLTKGEGAAKQYGYSPDSALSDLWFFLAQQGLPLNDDGAANRLDNPETVDAIRWYVGLWQAGIVPEYELGEAGEYDREMYARNRDLWESLISRGKMAMWSTYPGLGHSHYEVWKDLDVGLVPMPQGPSQVADLLLSVYYISAQAEHPEACWTWFKFLSSQVAAAQGIPARRSAAASEDYRQQLGTEVADVYLATLEGSERAIHLSSFYWDSYLGLIQKAVIRALQGEDVEQALRQVQDQAEE